MEGPQISIIYLINETQIPNHLKGSKFILITLGLM